MRMMIEALALVEVSAALEGFEAFVQIPSEH